MVKSLIVALIILSRICMGQDFGQMVKLTDDFFSKKEPTQIHRYITGLGYKLDEDESNESKASYFNGKSLVSFINKPSGKVSFTTTSSDLSSTFLINLRDKCQIDNDAFKLLAIKDQQLAIPFLCGEYKVLFVSNCQVLGFHFVKQ